MKAATTTQSQEGKGQKELKPLEFAFDARNKSIVPTIFAMEAKRLKKFFIRKPKVSLHQLEAALKQGAREDELRKMIPGFITSYYNNEFAHQYFESLGRLLLEASSKETEDATRQWFLMNQSLDITYLALQKSPKIINIPSQSIIVSLHKVMGASMVQGYYIEKEIHKEMMTMLNIKKDPNDFGSREKIIKLYMQGKRYYEAVIHSAEYEKIMQAKSRSLYRQKKGEIAMRKAGIFQIIIDYYYKIRTGTEAEGTNKTQELGKLSQFINRFNRDNRRINIVPLKGLDTLSLNKSLLSLVSIANTFYNEAGQVVHFQNKHKAYFQIARNNYQFENTKGAIHILTEGIRLLDTSNMQPKLRISEKMKFLEFQNRIYTELKSMRKADETTQEIVKLRKEIRAMDAKGI